MGKQKETGIMARIQHALSEFGARVFRNQVGRYKKPDDSYITYGLVPGSSDLIGWYSTVITQDMVGRKIALFTAVECKSLGGELTESQEQFLEVVRGAGGIGVVASESMQAVRQVEAQALGGGNAP